MSGTSNYLKNEPGTGFVGWLKSWFLTVDHKRIAIMYMIVVLAAFGAGGVYALMVRLELWHPNKDAAMKLSLSIPS